MDIFLFLFQKEKIMESKIVSMNEKTEYKCLVCKKVIFHHGFCLEHSTEKYLMLKNWKEEYYKTYPMEIPKQSKKSRLQICISPINDSGGIDG